MNSILNQHFFFISSAQHTTITAKVVFALDKNRSCRIYIKISNSFSKILKKKHTHTHTRYDHGHGGYIAVTRLLMLLLCKFDISTCVPRAYMRHKKRIYKHINMKRIARYEPVFGWLGWKKYPWMHFFCRVWYKRHGTSSKAYMVKRNIIKFTKNKSNHKCKHKPYVWRASVCGVHPNDLWAHCICIHLPIAYTGF